MIIGFMFSFFSHFWTKPLITSFTEIKDELSLEIQNKSKNCGHITIKDDHMTFYISCGLTIQKGFIPVKSIAAEYSGESLKIRNKDTNKTMLSIKSSKDVFDKLSLYLD